MADIETERSRFFPDLSVEDNPVEQARRRAHNAPLNPVFMDHTGHRHLGNHSTAWARMANEWMRLRKIQQEDSDA